MYVYIKRLGGGGGDFTGGKLVKINTSIVIMNFNQGIIKLGVLIL